MSSDSEASTLRHNTHETKNVYSIKKHKKKLEMPIREFTSDESDETKEPVNKLTSLVRETYLSYLIKLLSSNYNICTRKEFLERQFSERDIEQCAIQMEQKALRSSIVARLYQRAMSRMVADIKRNTELQKLHHKFCDFSPPSSDRETQTESFSHDFGNSGKMDSVDSDHKMAHFPTFRDNNGKAPVIIGNDILAPSILLNTIGHHWPPHTKRETKKLSAVNKSKGNTSPADINAHRDCLDDNIESLFHSYSESDECPDYEDKVCQESDEEASIIAKKPPLLQLANNGPLPNGSMTQLKSRPMQTLDERLAAFNFGSSTKLPCGELSPENESSKKETVRKVSAEENEEILEEFQESPGMSSLDIRLAEIHGELGLSSSKETVKHESNKPKKKLVWHYEEIYHIKRLKSKLRSLGKTKRSKVRQRFYELFEDNANASRKVRVRAVAEDPLLEFKDRIKPWVVKHLMPFYKSGKIETRDFFKHVAKHVTDSLVEINHLPGEADVVEYVNVLLNA